MKKRCELIAVKGINLETQAVSVKTPKMKEEGRMGNMRKTRKLMLVTESGTSNDKKAI